MTFPMWPAQEAAAILFQSFQAQPNSCIAGPRIKALSVRRPVRTTSAPCFRASTTDWAPKYAFAEITPSSKIYFLSFLQKITKI